MAEGGTRDRCSGVTRRRWPAGFVGMLGLVLAIEAGLAHAERVLEPLAVADWGMDRAAAAGEGACAEVLCFGDSLVKTGVAPAALEARLDRTAYNLAALGAPPPASYFQLKRALEAGARPRALVLDSNWVTLLSAYRPMAREWAALIGPGDALRLARDSRDPGFFTLYLVHYLVPSVRLRLDLRAATAATTAGLPTDSTARWASVIERQYEANRGAIFRPPTHPDEGADPYPDGALPPSEQLVCYPAAWTSNPANLAYLGKFLTLARSRGITVFFLIPPIHPGVQAERERRGQDATYEALIRKVHDAYPNVVVVDGRHAGFGHGAFADAHHLDLGGATALSHALAEVIAARLVSPPVGDRWVPLPGYTEPTARLAIEDMDESGAALARRDARR